MTGPSKEIQKEGTYNLYGDAERKVEIKALGDNGTFIRVGSKDVAIDGVCINGGLVYKTKQKPSEAGHTETESYVNDRRRLDARLRVEGSRGSLRGGG